MSTIHEINEIFSALELDPSDGALILRALDVITELYAGGLFLATSRGLAAELARLLTLKGRGESEF